MALWADESVLLRQCVRLRCNLRRYGCQGFVPHNVIVVLRELRSGAVRSGDGCGARRRTRVTYTAEPSASSQNVTARGPVTAKDPWRSPEPTCDVKSLDPLHGNRIYPPSFHGCRSLSRFGLLTSRRSADRHPCFRPANAPVSSGTLPTVSIPEYRRSRERHRPGAHQTPSSRSRIRTKAPRPKDEVR